MSKKLLMSNNKGTINLPGYASNGIILHLDAISNTRNGNNTSSSVWEDLSGNDNDFTMISDGAVTFNDNYVRFNGVSGMKIIDFSKFETLMSTSNCFTLEIVFDFDDVYNAPIFVNNSNLTISFGYWRGHIMTSASNEKRRGWDNKDYHKDASFTAITYKTSSDGTDILYKDGVLLDRTSGVTDFYNSSGETVYIGRNGGGSSFYNGNIRSIRLYDRALTEDEMYQNRQLDIERFNLK